MYMNVDILEIVALPTERTLMSYAFLILEHVGAVGPKDLTGSGDIKYGHVIIRSLKARGGGAISRLARACVTSVSEQATSCALQ